MPDPVITQLLVRQGEDADRQQVVLAPGELAYTIDTKRVYVGDGSTLGGIPIPNVDNYTIHYNSQSNLEISTDYLATKFYALSDDDPLQIAIDRIVSTTADPSTLTGANILFLDSVGNANNDNVINSAPLLPDTMLIGTLTGVSRTTITGDSPITVTLSAAAVDKSINITHDTLSASDHTLSVPASSLVSSISVNKYGHVTGLSARPHSSSAVATDVTHSILSSNDIASLTVDSAGHVVSVQSRAHVPIEPDTYVTYSVSTSAQVDTITVNPEGHVVEVIYRARIPTPPILNPAHAVDASSATISWIHLDPDVTMYTLYADVNATFTTTLSDQASITHGPAGYSGSEINTATLTGLSASTQYYVRAQYTFNDIIYSSNFVPVSTV
jgi:hypothetical protein